MYFVHLERRAIKYKRSMHPSSPAYTPWCSQCVTLAAQADLEKARKKLEAEGGADPPAYMRDRAWNAAHLQHVITKQKVKKTRKRGQVHQEREEVWDEARQRYMAQYKLPPPDSLSSLACMVCAKTVESGHPDEEQVIAATMAWWERQGALVVDQIPLPNLRSPSATNRKRPRQPTAKCQSYLCDLIQSYRAMRTASDTHRQAWEDLCKTERAVRRKYDLPNDLDIDPEFLTNPIPASHARHHHRQTQDCQHSGERRARRYTRRAEGYRPSRTSLALSKLAEDITTDDTELEKLRLAEKEAQLQRLAGVVATEVGYLYFVGNTKGSEDWRDDIEQGNRYLVYRKVEENMDLELPDQEYDETERTRVESEEEL